VSRFTAAMCASGVTSGTPSAMAVPAISPARHRRRDPQRIKRFFEEVAAGTIWINDPLTDNQAGPFGGMRMSGGCRELGQEGFDEFRATKHVHWDFSTEPKEFWYPHS